jgi:hypothetical protein
MVGMSDSFGVMTAAHTPRVAEGIIEGRLWACDNEAFTGKFTEERFFGHLERLEPYRATCLFVSCLDAVGDSVATLERWHEWSGRIRTDGWPVAFVCQDGQMPDGIPECDAVFIGGTTEFKLSPIADDCIREGKRRGIWVHVGRVNSGRRIRHFQLMEVDSVDGTAPCYGPDIHERKFSRSLAQRSLFSLLSVGNRPGEFVIRAFRTIGVGRECVPVHRPRSDGA